MLPCDSSCEDGYVGRALRGVIAPEYLDPIKFLKMMADMGGPAKFHEVCSREVSVS